MALGLEQSSRFGKISDQLHYGWCLLNFMVVNGMAVQMFGSCWSRGPAAKVFLRFDQNLFQQLARHIRANGHEEAFYQETFIYFEEDGMLYWTMDALISDTTIINRFKKESSYECRLKYGTLP